MCAGVMVVVEVGVCVFWDIDSGLIVSCGGVAAGLLASELAAWLSWATALSTIRSGAVDSDEIFGWIEAVDSVAAWIEAG